METSFLHEPQIFWASSHQQNSEYYFGPGFLKTLSALPAQMSVKPAFSTDLVQDSVW